MVGIDCAQQIIVRLWRIALPERAQLGNRRIVPIDTQIDRDRIFIDSSYTLGGRSPDNHSRPRPVKVIVMISVTEDMR